MEVKEVIIIEGVKYIFFNNNLIPVPTQASSSLDAATSVTPSVVKPVPSNNSTKTKHDDSLNLDDEDEVDDDENVEDRNSSSTGGKSKKNRVKWSEEEIKKIISIFKDKNILAKLDGKCGRLSHSLIFKSVAKALNDVKLGKPRSDKQCLLKFRKLRDKYKKCSKNLNRSGKSAEKCDYFDELHKAFGSRPKIQAREWGIDSSSLPDADQMDEEEVNLTKDFDRSPLKQSEKSETTNPDESPAKPSSRSPVKSSRSPSKKRLARSPKKSFPPRYRSGAGRVSNTQALVRELLEKEVKESAMFREWTKKQLKEQEKNDEKFLAGISTAITSRLASIGQMFLAQNSSNFAQNSSNFPNFAPVSAPIQNPPCVPKYFAAPVRSSSMTGLNPQCSISVPAASTTVTGPRPIVRPAVKTLILKSAPKEPTTSQSSQI